MLIGGHGFTADSDQDARGWCTRCQVDHGPDHTSTWDRRWLIFRRGHKFFAGRRGQGWLFIARRRLRWCLDLRCGGWLLLHIRERQGLINYEQQQPDRDEPHGREGTA